MSSFRDITRSVQSRRGRLQQIQDDINSSADKHLIADSITSRMCGHGQYVSFNGEQTEEVRSTLPRKDEATSTGLHSTDATFDDDAGTCSASSDISWRWWWWSGSLCDEERSRLKRVGSAARLEMMMPDAERANPFLVRRRKNDKHNQDSGISSSWHQGSCPTETTAYNCRIIICCLYLRRLRSGALVKH